MTAARSHPARRAFTLIELTMALLVTTVLIGAVGSLVVMTTRAAAGNPRPQSTDAGAAEAMDRLASELACAITVSEATSSAVAFTVADRDSNAQPEAIRYSWAGAGQVLRRELNGGAPVSVTERLSQLNLAYTTTKKTTSSTVNSVADSGEVLFASFTGWTGITPTTRELGVTPVIWGSQFFRLDKVALPETLTELRITKVRLMMRRGTVGDVTVSIQGQGVSPEPNGVNKGSLVSNPFAALPVAQAWVDIALTDVTFSSRLTDFNILIKGTGTTSGFVRYLDSLLAPVDAPTFLYTTDSGATWQPALTRQRQEAPFEVYGSYKWNVSTPADVDTYTLYSTSITLQPVGASSPAITKVRALNRPIVPATVTASADPIPSL